MGCKASGLNPDDHFNQSVKMVGIGSKAARDVSDWKLSQHTCHLVAMEGDAAKERFDLASAFFSVKPIVSNINPSRVMRYIGSFLPVESMYSLG